jgi:hypothetical protein
MGAVMGNPWMKFFPADWRSDPKLRVCSPAARGLWMDMICLMHEAEPYGHLLVNRKPPTDTQLGALTGIASSTVRTLLSELEEAGVFSRNRSGVIYSRRMVADAKKAETARKNGQKGGNPNLCNNKDFPPSDNPPDNPGVNGGDKTHIPEARKADKNPPHGPPLPNGADGGCGFDRFWTAYPSRGDEPNPPKPARAQFDRLVAAGADPAAIIAGAVGYAEHCRRTGRQGGRYVMKAATFLEDGVFEQFAAKPRGVPDAASPAEWRQRLADWAARGRRLWPKCYGPAPGEPDCWIPAEIVAEFMEEPAA